MKTYRKKTVLPSVDLTLDVVKQLEELLRAELSRFGDIQNEEVAKALTTSVKDDDGIELFSTIAQFDLNRFRNGTNEVEIKARWSNYETERAFAVAVTFGCSMFSTYITIDISGDDPQQNVLGISEKALRVLSQHISISRFANPPIGYYGVVFVALIVIGGVVFYFFGTDGFASTFPYFLLAIPTALAFKDMLVPPYTCFDTPGNERKLRNLKWFASMLATFVIGGVLFTYIRKSSLGF